VTKALKVQDKVGRSKVLVGFGNWSQQKGLKGGPNAPVKTLRRELRKHATVIKIDEYRTSQVCSSCHYDQKRLENVSYKEENGEDGGMEEVKCHEVVRCKNEDCSMYWQRDRNASRNMYELLRALVRGEERPLVFRRGQKWPKRKPKRKPDT